MIGKFITKDFTTIIVLMAAGHTLVHKQWRGKSCFLAFDNVEKCEATLQKHFNGQLMLSTKVLVAAIQEARSIIRQKDNY